MAGSGFAQVRQRDATDLSLTETRERATRAEKGKFGSQASSGNCRFLGIPDNT